MTPLIDVMLVLLVIFMLTAPLLTSSLKLDLPRADAAQPEATEGEVIAVAVAADGRFFWGDVVVSEAELRRRIEQEGRRDAQREVQLRADTHSAYGVVARLIGWLQQGGFERIAFVTEEPPSDGEVSGPARPAPAPAPAR